MSIHVLLICDLVLKQIMNLKVKILICLTILVFSVSAYLGFVNEMKKIPLDYVALSEHEGQDQVLASINGAISEPFWIRETLKDIVVNKNNNILEINSHVEGVDSATNKIVFENTQTFFVDRTTRKHQNSDDYFMFPPNVEKKNYQFFFPMMFTKTIFVFDNERTINDLQVYDFTCSYKGVDVSSSFPQFSGQIIHSDGSCTITVEPVTGKIVYFSKNWDDYMFNNGVRGAQVELGGKHTTEYSQSILVEQAKSTKFLYYFLDVILPSLMIVIGVITVLVVVLFEKIKHQTKLILDSQTEMLKKERLSAIGEITAKISHDLRNPLSLIKLTIDGIQMRFEKNLDPKLDEYLPLINDAISKLTYQINQVLGYVKTIPLDVRLVSLSSILNDAINYTNIPNHISVKLPKNDFSLMADKIQLSIAFGNILSNAKDAIGEKTGTIHIRIMQENENLIIEFEDSGDGISNENIGKIFTPLFTTKSNGTGLGLSSVKDIVKAHGGSISVRSPPTIFTVILPQNQKIKN